MQTLQIIGIIAAILLLSTIYFAVWTKLNAHCISRYEYNPLNRWTMIAAFVAVVCLWLGLTTVFGDSQQHPFSLAEIQENARYWESRQANGIVLAAAGLVVGGATFARLVFKTSVASGILAAILLTISGSLFVITIVVTIAAALFIKENKRRSLW